MIDLTQAIQNCQIDTLKIALDVLQQSKNLSQAHNAISEIIKAREADRDKRLEEIRADIQEAG